MPVGVVPEYVPDFDRAPELLGGGIVFIGEQRLETLGHVLVFVKPAHHHALLVGVGRRGQEACAAGSSAAG